MAPGCRKGVQREQRQEARGGPGGGGAGALPLGGSREKNRGGSVLGAAPDVILTLSPHWVCGVSFFRFIKYHRQDFFFSLEIEIEKEGATDRVSEDDQQLDFKEVGQRDGRNAFNQDRGIHQCRPYAIAPNALKSFT